MLKISKFAARSLSGALASGLLMLAAGAQAAVTPFSTDVGASIDKGLAWQAANFAYTGNAGDATGLSLLALLQKRVDGSNPDSVSQGYALASAADKARMDSAVAYILANNIPRGYFYAYPDGADMMALSNYLLTGGPNPGVLAALNTIFDRTVANQRVGMADDSGNWPENNGYWCYTNDGCRDSSTTQLVVAGLAALKGVYISATFGDPTRAATLNAVTARARTAYQRNGVPGYNPYLDGASCSITDPAEKGHGYNAGSYNTLQQTASGTWIQLVGGADVNDPDVQKYLRWLLNRYDYKGQNAEAYEYWASYYYYLWSSSKAYEFIASGAPIAAGNIGPDNFGVKLPGAAPACASRQVHRNPVTDSRTGPGNTATAGYYSVELPRVYYDMAYTLMGYQCASGDFHCNSAPGDWNSYAGNAYALLVLQRSLGGGCIDLNNNGVCDALEKRCDVNGDGKINKADLLLITKSKGKGVLFAGDPRDGNGDGKIDLADVAYCTPKCTNAGCAP